MGRFLERQQPHGNCVQIFAANSRFSWHYGTLQHQDYGSNMPNDEENSGSELVDDKTSTPAMTVLP
jgi:hypothetical protein